MTVDYCNDDDAGRLNTPINKTHNREGWLLAACDKLVPALRAAGAGKTPRYRVSVGWPLGVRPRGKFKSETIGQCFCSTCSKDGTHEMFISPTLDDAATVLATLVHELVHAFVGIKAKHGQEFKVVAIKVGLTGKMTATTANEELTAKLKDLAKDLGPYPHASLGTKDSLKPKQSTRLIKLTCPSCGYVIRTTQKWIDIGVPICPCGGEFKEGGLDE